MSIVAEQLIGYEKELRGERFLELAARIWFAIAISGQGLFVFHIIHFYGGTALSGELARWNEVLYHGWIHGDPMGNIALVAHLILAIIITVGGSLQLIPFTQQKARAFHRWNGRIYMFTAIVISLSGLYMIFVRGVVGGTVMAIGNIINASLIMVSAVMAGYYAMNRKIQVHRKWALRLYVLAAGVWFYRVVFGFWILLNQGAPGHTNTFDGPFDIFLAFAHTLLPVALLEVYLIVKDGKSGLQKKITASGLLVLTAVMGLGIFMATIIFWLPKS